MTDARKIEISYSGIKPIVMFGVWPHEVKILKTETELAEWERRMEAFTGVRYDARAIVQSGGCCCGGDGDGMCDQD